MASIPPENVAQLKKAIGDYLKSKDVFSQVRAFVADYVKDAEGERSIEDIISAFKERGAIQQILQGLASQPRITSHLMPAHGALPKPAAAQAFSSHRRYLHLQISRGRAFTGGLSAPSTLPEYLEISISFLQQRFMSSRAPFGVEPTFDDDFLLDLQALLRNGDTLGRAGDPQQLVRHDARVHIAVLRVADDGQRSLVGVQTLDWRKVLVSGNVSLPLELSGVGLDYRVPAGILDVRMELLPPPAPGDLITEGTLRDQLRAEVSEDADATAQLITYAKGWWGDYLGIREGHKRRLVKLLAHAENGEQKLVCTFVTPMSAGRLLATPREAAHFVALLDYREEPGMGASREETWHSVHTFLSKGHGYTEDHAVLLCSLLLGFGLDAYVCVGKDQRGGHAWVVTLSSKKQAVFWEPLSGKRYIPSDPVSMQRCPYRSIGCLFNHRSFYANCQVDDSVRAVSFHLENGAAWKSLEPSFITRLRRPPPVALRPPTINAAAAEEELELALRQVAERHRATFELSTVWDEGLSYLLMPALAAYQGELVTGVSSGNEEFQQSIKRAVPTGFTFKGYPQHFNHYSPSRIMRELLQQGVAAEILGTRGDLVRFGLRARISPFPEGVCSVWVMIAVRYRGLDDM
eukprot:jgi/Mesvir1/11752/Mv00123-RA.1